MKELVPITVFPSRFKETEESYISRGWVKDYSCSNFWEEFKKDNTESDDYDFLVDEVAIKHWLYCASSCPDFKVCSDKEDFMDAIKCGYAGDIFEIWILSDTPKYYCFKCPNENGDCPTRGSY